MKRSFWLLVCVSCVLGYGASAALYAATNGSPKVLAANPTAAAREALFERSQVDVARTQARVSLRRNPRDVEALFVEMEAAALEADSRAELDAALRLCELRGSVQRDDRVAVAAARILDMAANTQEFRSAIPRIQALIARPHSAVNYLRAALVAAARDGVPGLDMRQLAHESGFITDWRVAGPFGKFPNLDFDQHWTPEEDALALAMSGARAVEDVSFDDGNFRLPGYFDRNGVFYAAADATVRATGEWRIRVESGGTLEVFVDGASVLRKDDRLRETAEIASRKLRMRAGSHRVVVKFIPSALPFRIAVLPASTRAVVAAPLAIDYTPEAAYVTAARKYWDGDFSGTIAILQQARKQRDTAISSFLLYQAWTHVAEDAPEAAALLASVLRASPEALRSEYELAERAYAAERTDEALTRVQRILDKRHDFAPAQHLMGQLAIRLHWPVRGATALEIYIALHPSCDALREAQRFFAGHARYDQAHTITRQLADCSPDSLAYVHALGEEGRHAEAAAAAREKATRRPLDREARELLARELAMAGDSGGAREALRALAAMAPNSERYGAMAAQAGSDVQTLLDDDSVGAAQFSVLKPFYQPFRRDGLQVVKQTAERHFAGGPAVVLVDDQVARLWPDGRVSVYMHKITRVLDRDGVERYGEVELPRGAEALELRTLKSDGGIAEPEFSQQKATMSMPGLLPGDAVEQEYVVNYPDRGGMAAHPSAFQHTFGSFRAPILYSRFAIITPDKNNDRVVSTSDAETGTGVRDGVETRTWEKNDIAQSTEEIATAKGDVLAMVRVEEVAPGGWDDVRRYYQNAALEAMRIGPRVEQAAERLRPADEESRARAAYHKVVSNIRPAGASFGEDMPSAEASLATGAGSRTATLLAIARAAGLRADLILARSAGTVIGKGVAPPPSVSAYARPLVQFHVSDAHGETHEVVADAETEGLAFGALPPSIERGDALRVTGDAETSNGQAAIMQLPGSTVADQSVARGDVTLDAEGNINASVSIVLGAWRAAQMRSILSGIETSQRAHFFQQLAMRIFPGADNVTGETRNEHSPDYPLEISLRCRSLNFVNLARGSADIDQLVPALGLKKMYIGGTNRQFPLFLDTPLFETSTFRVHLPAGISVVRNVGDADVTSEFGKYSVSVREIEARTWEIRRGFQIPAQVVPAERFGEFAKFAAQIDDIERQRLTLEREQEQARAPGQ